ncbi:protein kinase [Sorangium sp. So ce1014]|uniref:serine/threonine protein kinase n=1 Tax=Sorangium sp. So ce1014 TaxID=3133326 RepID=UPI003F626B9F
MVAVGENWEGHELISELERGMVRTFLARPIGDPKSPVWLHMREGARIDRKVFASEIDRLQRLSEKVPEIARVHYGGLKQDAAWAVSTFHKDAIRLKDAIRGAELGMTAIDEVGEIGIFLQRANDLGFAHGALSPERVLITADKHYAITHFGFPRLFQISGEEATREPRYAAPEMVFEGDIGLRTDVYGIGTILYELLCGRELYSDSEPDRVQGLSGKLWEPPIPLWVPQALVHVIKKALAKEPKDRYSSVRSMLVELTVREREFSDFFARLHSNCEKETDVAVPLVAHCRRPRAEMADMADDLWEPFVRPENDSSDGLEASEASEEEDEDGGMERPSSPIAPTSPEAHARETVPTKSATMTEDSVTAPPSDRGFDVPELEPLPSSPQVPPSPVRGTERTAPRSLARFLALAFALGSVLGTLIAFRWSEHPVKLVARLPPIAKIPVASASAVPVGGPSEVDRQPSSVALVSAQQQPARMPDAASRRQPAESSTSTGATESADGIYIYNGDTSF